MSSTSHIKRKAGEPEERPLSAATWVFLSLSLLGAALSYHLAARWAPQASGSERFTLSASVALFVWLSRHVRLRPPSDPLSRLRAPWDPSARRLALLVSGALFAVSLGNLQRVIFRPVTTLSPERVLSYAPLSSGAYYLSGTPKVETPPYRWVLDEAAQAEEEWLESSAPYLIPVQEFKGQLLLISDELITEPFKQLEGRLLSSYETAQGSFLSYRSYMGLAREAVIYLVELRGARWFDIKATMLCLWSLILLIGVWSTATRDPENKSGLLYIPPDLLEGIEVEESETAPESALGTESGAALEAAPEAAPEPAEEG